MKKLYILLLCVGFASSAISQSYIAYVHGYVKNHSGNAIANKRLVISTDSSVLNSCSYIKPKTTNANGFYSDTIFCTFGITRSIRISIDSCNRIITKNYPVTSSGSIEANFIVCDSSITTPPINCTSNFSQKTNKFTVQFNSNNATISSGDSIIQRTWNFGDGTMLNGNIKEPSKKYNNQGFYTACLSILTAKGCSNTFCMVVSIKDTIATPPPNTSCKSYFTFIPSSNSVKFNSSNSFKSATDSIISRTWDFGDSMSSNSILRGNIIEPTYTYSRSGIYKVCLTIITKLGCTNTYCAKVVTNNSTRNCIPQFIALQALPTSKIVNFNSQMSWTPLNDSIIERNWNFGDATTLVGNVINPVKIYPLSGIYKVCLKIKTANACISETCKSVVVTDSLIFATPDTSKRIKITNIFPIPAVSNVAVNIWCGINNTRCELSIYDIYGSKKWGNVISLLQGNNIQNIPISLLPRGPYFIRVNTAIGNDNKPFYKM